MHVLVRRAALPLALLGSAIAAVPAGAAPPDPQTTNVPYLAWRGEHLRLVKCDKLISGEGQTIDVLVEDWSGADPDRAKPTVVPGSTKFFFDDSRGWCARSTLVSVKAGIAPVKLVISNGAGDQVLTHQFQAAWLNLTTPSIHEVAATDQTGDPWLGDPAGDGNFPAGGNAGRVQVKVKGTLPLLGNYAELGLGASITLPDQWAALAGALATDADPFNLSPANRWDIHDDTVLYASPLQDGVDNVWGDAFTFYRKVLGDTSTAPTNGPFDPQRPGETFLPDGKVDAGDAPMPAARVDIAIAPNSGLPGDISGVGSLGSVYKQRVYSRDHAGSATDHNIYAPFNKQWIPATAAGPAASGVDGEAANNFNGFLVNGLYTNWDVAATLVTALGGNTNCLLRRSPANMVDLARWDKQFRQLPYGAQNIVVYTDEHGEAQASYTPGTGMYYDNVGAIMNDNGGCDLQGIDVIGTSNITATARYPYQPVTDPAKTSVPLTKVVHSLFDKNLTYWPKGPGPENDVARIVVAHAQDVNGAGFDHERVCFMADSLIEGMKVFTGVTGPASARISLAGSYRADDPEGLNRLCVYTNRYGNAAVEIFNSNKGVADVIADFVDEGILRSIKVNFNVPGSSSGTPAVTPPAPAVIAKVAPKPNVVPKPTFKLGPVRLMNGKNGRYILVRVNSKKPRAVIRVRLQTKGWKLVGAKTMTIRTNRNVRLAIKLPSKAKRVSVRVIRVR
jgi:hypothetical protein